MSKCSTLEGDQQLVWSNSAAEWDELGCCIVPHHRWSGRRAQVTSQTRYHEQLLGLVGQYGQHEAGGSGCGLCTHSA